MRMDDFKLFYLLILLSSSVILFYFSFKSIVLIVLLTVIVLWGTNVVNGSWKRINISVKQKLTKTLKGNEKKYQTKVNSRKNKQREQSSYLLNDSSTSTMSSTIKLTPGPSLSPRTSYFKNQQHSSPSPYFRTAVLNNSSSFFDRSDDHLSVTPQHPMAMGMNSPTPFLPTIKRALGVSEYLPRKYQPATSPSYPSHPSGPSSGFVPAVRLHKRERSHLGQQKAARSPNTVRIAPPEPHKLSSPRLFHIHTSNTESRRTPDTQAVILALREKSLKRTYGGYDHDTSYSDYPVQQAKRRRQDSQQSNSSTSSLPPLPDSLPDLSSSGYNIPRLETPTLKRSALDLICIEDWDDSCSAKRLRKDGRVNPILSSLSSSQRVAEKEKQVKRKVSTSDNKENSDFRSKQAKQVHNGSFSLDRSDTVLIPTDGGLDISAVDSDTPLKDKSTLNTSEVTDKPKLDKKITLNQSFTARKRQMSLYSGLNKSFQKVPHANVIASMEDYENDMGAEKKRVQEMLEEIHQAETEKEKEKEKKDVEEKAKKLIAAVTANIPQSTTPVASLQTSTVSTSTTLTVPSVSAAVPLTPSRETTTSIQSSVPINTVSSHIPVTASPLTFNFATVKSSSPSKTTPKGFGIPTTNITTSAGLRLVSSTGSNSTTVTSTSFSFGTQPAATLQTGLSSGIASSTTAANQNVSSGFNLGTNVSLSTTPGSFTLGNMPPTSITKAATSAAPTIGFGTNLTAPPSTRSSTPSGFNFGVAPPSIGGNQTQPTPSFGAPSQSNPPFGMPTQSKSSQPSFGQTSTTTTTFSTGTNPTASTFNFKPFGTTPAQQTTPQASTFGQQPAAGIATFGTVTSTAAPTPGFGATSSSFGQTATSTAPSSGFNMGSNTSSFGTQGSTNFGTLPGTGFGTAATQSGPFGAATTQAGFSFGPQTTAGNSFGQGSGTFGTANTTKASSFGQSASSFGTAVTTSSGFGGFGQGTASFGPTPGTGSSFGAAGPTFGQASSTFGAASTTKSSSSFGTPTFGAPNTTASSTFGTAGTSFGAPNTTASSTFGTAGTTFGQGSNTFGAATTQQAASSTFGTAGTTFGQGSNTFGAATTQAASSTFAFGAPSTPANKGGFDFSGSSTPANNGGFNFRNATVIGNFSEKCLHLGLKSTVCRKYSYIDEKGDASEKSGSSKSMEPALAVEKVNKSHSLSPGKFTCQQREEESCSSAISSLSECQDIEEISLPADEDNTINLNLNNTSTVFFDLETTGLGMSCDITQIAAVCGLKKYSEYVMPQKPITPAASEVTGITKLGNVIYRNGIPVPYLNRQECLKELITWLPENAVLFGHNVKSFDSRIIVKALMSENLIDEFKTKCKGFVDTLHVFRTEYPERKKEGKSFKQQELVKDFLGDRFHYDAHNALGDVLSLQELYRIAGFAIANVKPHSFSVDLACQSVINTEMSNRNFKSLKNLPISDGMRRKMAISGLNIQDLKLAFKGGGVDGINHVMSEEIKGKVRVTKNKQIIAAAAQFIKDGMVNDENVLKTKYCI